MEKSTFFNSEFDKEGNADRPYNAEDFAEYFSSFIGNGIFPLDNTGLMVLANNDNTVIVKKGKAFINGYYYNNTDDLIFRIENPDGVLNRIDRMVVRLDFLKREVKTIIKKGDWNSSAKAKQLQRDANAYELALADIQVSAGAVRITQKDITDLRFNKKLCGLVHAIVEQIDSTIIFKQFSDWYKQQQDSYIKDINNWTKDKQQAFERWFDKKTDEFIKFYDDKNIEFYEWFDKIKHQLNGDLATKIKIELEVLEKKVQNNEGNILNNKKDLNTKADGSIYTKDGIFINDEISIRRDAENKNVYFYNKVADKFLALHDDGALSYGYNNVAFSKDVPSNKLLNENGVFIENMFSISRNNEHGQLYIYNKKGNKFLALCDDGVLSYNANILAFSKDVPSNKNFNENIIDINNFTIQRDDQRKNIAIYNKKANAYFTLWDDGKISYKGRAIAVSGRPEFTTTQVLAKTSGIVTVKHNLGRIPIFTMSTTIGNVNPTITVTETELKLFNYSSNDCKTIIQCF